MFAGKRTNGSFIFCAILSNVRSLPHPDQADFCLATILFALSDPSRLHIVKALATGREMMCAEVEVPLCKSACSRHYKVLREAGLIRMRPEGTAYFNSLRRKDLNERFPGLLPAVLRSAGGPAKDSALAPRRAFSKAPRTR